MVIVKNASQEAIDLYRSALQIPEEDGARTLLSKTLETESCESLGFTYKKILDDEQDGATKNFVKKTSKCQEATLTNHPIQQGNISTIFFLRKK